MKKNFETATLDLLKELAKDPKNQIEFTANNDGSHREYVLISPKGERIFKIEYNESRIGNAPYICKLIVNGSQVNLPQKDIFNIMEILRKRHVEENQTVKRAKEENEQAALLNFLSSFHSKK